MPARVANDAKSAKKKHTLISRRADLALPVPRVLRLLRAGRYAQRISRPAAIYLTAILEYLAAEILEISVEVVKANNKQRITPRHLQLAIRRDDEIDKLLEDVIICQGGVMPLILPQLLPKKTVKKADTLSEEF